jgi:hypothetical protein
LELRSIYLQSGQYVLDAHPNTDPHAKSIRYADTNPCTHAVSPANANANANANSSADSDSNTHTDRDSYGYTRSHANTDPNPDAD